MVKYEAIQLTLKKNKTMINIFENVLCSRYFANCFICIANLIFKLSLQGNYCYSLHFTDEKTEG